MSSLDWMGNSPVPQCIIPINFSPPDPVFSGSSTPDVSFDSFLLQNSNVTSVLLNPTTLSAYKSKNEDLCSFLSENLTEILELFSSFSDAQLLSSISSLLLCPNTALLGQISRDLPSIELLASIFNSTELYQVGLATQIFSQCCSKFHQIFIPLIKESDQVLPTIFNNLHKKAISTLLPQIVQTPPLNQHDYIWGFVLAIDNTAPTLGIDCPAVSALSHSFGSNSIKRLQIYKLLRNYVVSTEPEQIQKELTNLVTKFIHITETDPEIIELLQLAVYLNKSSEMIDFSLMLISSANNPSLGKTEKDEKAIRYLTKYPPAKEEQLLLAIFKMLKNHPTTLVMQAIEDLLSTLPKGFIKVVQHMLTYIWNNRDGKGRRAYDSFLLRFSAIFLAPSSFPGWKQFCDEVVKKFEDNQEFEKSFTIDEVGCDAELKRICLQAVGLHEDICFSVGRFEISTTGETAASATQEPNVVKRRPSKSGPTKKRSNSLGKKNRESCLLI